MFEEPEREASLPIQGDQFSIENEIAIGDERASRPRGPADGGSWHEGVDADRPLESGMVLSIETTMLHPRRGFIELEDTVVGTANGCEMFGTR